MQTRVWSSARAILVVYVLLGGPPSCSSSHPAQAKEPSSPCPLPNPVLAISASNRINASSSGQGRPVQVRVYQLKSDARLLKAKFEDVWQNEAATFETDLVKVDEYTIYPAESKVVKVTRSPDANTLAAVALFREPQGKNWYLTYGLEPAKKEGACGPAEPRISLWLDRMQIEDGQGRVSGSDSPSAGGDTKPVPNRGQDDAAGPKGP